MGRKDQEQAMSSGKSPVYQIDFSAVACGSRIASTKRKIRWRFGFSNQEALVAGLTGQDCRGEEHDIVLTWSIASGKRILHVDQQEVHYSNSRSGIFEFSWTMRGNHVLKVVAHASPPLACPPGFRQYEFFVDGLSFFSFPKVFRLNLANNDRFQYNSSSVLPVAEGRRNQQNQPTWQLEQPQNEQEEEAILRETMMQSLKENQEKEEDEEEIKTKSPQPTAPVPTQAPGDDVLDFFSAPAIQRTNSDPGPPEVPNQYFDSSVSFAGTDSAPYLANQAPTPSDYGAWAQPARVENGVTSAPASNAYDSSQYAQPTYTTTGYASTPYATPSQYAPAPAAPSTSQMLPSYSNAPTPATFTSTPTTTNYAPAPFATSSSGQPAFAQPIVAESSSETPSAPKFSHTKPVLDQTLAVKPFSETTPASDFATGTSANFKPTSVSALDPAPTPAADFEPRTFENYSDPKLLVSSAQPTLNLNVGSTLADKAYLDIANNFTLSLDEPKEDKRANPFDKPSTTSGPAPTLEGLKTSKPETEKKPVMSSGTLVMSTTQHGNWGSYDQTGATNQGHNETGNRQQNYGYNNNNQAYGGYNMQQVPYNNSQQQYYSQQQAPYSSTQQQQFSQHQVPYNMQQQHAQHYGEQQTPSYQQQTSGYGQYQQNH